MARRMLKNGTSVVCFIGGAVLLFGCAIETSSGPSTGTPATGDRIEALRNL
jgi:hypothetical protein